MSWLKRIIHKTNLFFSSLILALFYIFIIPVGTLIYRVTRFLNGNKKDGLWMKPEQKQIDISSPY